MGHAAIFDLDRTLIAGSSAHVFGAKLREVGVELPSPPGQSVYFRLYEQFGEDPVTMRVARYASKLFAGQRVSAVQLAGRLAADVVATKLLPDAARAFERHRAQGAHLLLATTAPAELAEPLGQAWGLDTILCTHYRSSDGVYDGTNDGQYLWGTEKADAVATWAGQHSIDLTASAAYSDSWYDMPLLELVGVPVPVNADLRLSLAARSRNWPRQSWESG